MLGLYVSDHPLMGFEAALARHTDCTLSDMREEDPASGTARRCARSAGVVTDLRRSYTKKGDLMARFVLEDLQAAMEVFVFPKTMAEYGALDRERRHPGREGPARHPGGRAQDRLHGGLAARCSSGARRTCTSRCRSAC